MGNATRFLARTFLAILLLAGNARSGTLTKTVRFENPSILSSGGAGIEVRGCRSLGMPGEPMLPVYTARFILPPNETASSITVAPDRTVEIALAGDIAPMPPQVPIGAAPTIAVSRDESIYASSAPFPAKRGVIATEQTLAGIRILFVNVYPCQAVPASKMIVFAPALTITVTTVPAASAAVEAPASQLHRALETVKRFVENPEEAAAYGPAAFESSLEETSAESAECVVITSPGLAASFEPLAGLKRRLGLRTRIVDTSWISAQYAGADTQERIRNFIKYAYANWGTRYVILGGDNETIPHRGFYVKFGTNVNTDIPSDLYYACLDGTWNSDGDAYFGEPGEEDLLPEVSVGRLPVDSPEDVANLTAKISAYALSPAASRCASALMVGELLWSINGVNTYGCDYKDEILFGSSSYGATTAGIPSTFDRETLYDRDLGSWDADDLIPMLNAGVNLVNHLGHSNLLSVMRLDAQDVASLANGGSEPSFFVCYSQGCYAASFDNRDDAGVVHTEDCIGEELVTGPNGAVAFVGNTRLGWAAPGTTCGASQFFDRQFFDAIFGEGITTLGEALDYSRVVNIPAVCYDGVRWVYYELCLLGDPSLSLWTDTPRALAVSRDTVIYAGQRGFDVHVSDAYGSVPGAVVSIGADVPELFRSATTNEWGEALLDVNTGGEGAVLLSITAQNHYPYADTIAVASQAPLLASIDSITVRDGGSETGSVNGVAEPNERIGLGFVLANLGAETLHSVGIEISASDSALSIVDSSCAIGDVAPGGRIAVDSAFEIRVAPWAPNAHEAAFVLRVRSSDGDWRVPGSLRVSAGEAVLESWSMSDAPHGNGNGCLEAWEFQNITSTWRNEGSVDILSPRVVLSFPPDSWGKAVKFEQSAPVLPAGAAASFPGELLWFVGEFTPPFTEITLFLTFTGANLAAQVCTLQVRTCGYDLESSGDAESPLTHRALVGADEWHVSTERYHSAPGSWKCGEVSHAYANMMDAVLTLPPMCLFTGSSLTFWHRMNAEATTTSPYWALDAGVVELSRDGGATWSIISPVTPYPSRASPYNSIFLAAYQRCYSGTFDWKMETFNLSAYTGPVMLRFRFASDEQNGFEGWHIDDIHVTTEVPTDVGDGGAPRALSNALEPAYPNPFNPSTVIPFELAERGNVNVSVFDVAGRRVRLLMAAIREAGRHSVTWDGTNDRGAPVASGVYLVRLKTGPYAATERLVLVR